MSEDFESVIKVFVAEYMESFKVPVSLYILNKRFGVRLKAATGETLKEFVSRRSDTFVTKLTRTGASTVELKRESPIEGCVRDALSGGPMTAIALRTSLRDDYGLSESEIIETVVSMQMRKVIKDIEGIISLC